MMSMGVSATQIESQDYKTLIHQAASVFPEYAEKLLNPTYELSDFTRTTTSRTLVKKETRALSDTETISLTEYSDGLILLSDEIYHETTPVGSIPHPDLSVRNFTINVRAICVSNGYSGVFYLDNVSYTINAGLDNYDSITNFGTAREGNNCISSERMSITPNETAYGYARIAYDLGFKNGPRSEQFLTTELILHVGEDTAVIDHYARD